MPGKNVYQRLAEPVLLQSISRNQININYVRNYDFAINTQKVVYYYGNTPVIMTII